MVASTSRAAASAAAGAGSSGSKRRVGGASEGGSTTSKKAAKKSRTNASTSTADEAAIPLGKALASTEKRVRDGAVHSLTAYLAANGAHTIPPLELQKLWKGLFYCFWMSDKPLIQQRLANDLANLVLVHPSSSSSTSSGDDVGEEGVSERALGGLKFLETFWDTLIAEWAGLDKHRIDKYYLLVRRFVAAGFRLLAEEGWNAKAVHRFGEILGKFPGGALSTNDPKVPDSLTYHLSDIYLDELEKVLQFVHDSPSNLQGTEDGEEEEEDEEVEKEEEEDLPLVPTLELLQPFVDALATAKSKAMYDRIWANVFEPLLEDTLRASARDDDNDDDDEEEEDSVSDTQPDPERSAAHEDEEGSGDETANGTEFHSFADESELIHAGDEDNDESEPSLPSDTDQDDEDDEDEDVRYPLLLALSTVKTPTTEQEDEDVEQMDVALVLRNMIFQALFTAASRKDATEARRRLLYQLWRDEQERLNNKHD